MYSVIIYPFISPFGLYIIIRLKLIHRFTSFSIAMYLCLFSWIFFKACVYFNARFQIWDRLYILLAWQQSRFLKVRGCHQHARISTVAGDGRSTPADPARLFNLPQTQASHISKSEMATSLPPPDPYPGSYPPLPPPPPNPRHHFFWWHDFAGAFFSCVFVRHRI